MNYKSNITLRWSGVVWSEFVCYQYNAPLERDRLDGILSATNITPRCGGDVWSYFLNIINVEIVKIYNSATTGGRIFPMKKPLQHPLELQSNKTLLRSCFKTADCRQRSADEHFKGFRRTSNF
jgi:hypothetical protein